MGIDEKIRLEAKIMRHVSSALTAIIVAVGVGICATASADTRGISVQLRASDDANAPVTETVKLYGSSHALVIGIDRYTGGWSRLSNAVNDARAVAEELDRQGFDVTLKTDLTATRLDQSLKEFFAIKGNDPDARLLLWYAGHGHTLRGEGYLVPSDAPPASSPRFLITAIPMRGFGTLVRYARSKHVLAVFDSCFSGTVFAARAGALPAAITKKTTKPVRQFLTSGDAGQQVRDDGSFRKLFLRALRGEERADANRDGYLTGEELGLFLSQEVATLTSAAQTPKHGKLHDVEFNQGDFVFVLPKVAEQRSPYQGVRRQAEIVVWQSIKDSTNPEMFKEYLRQFPEGQFSRFARIKLKELKGEQMAALPPVPTFQITPVDEEMVAAKTANVRAEPSTTSSKIGRLVAGKKVDVTGKATISGATWYRVALVGNRTGYVFGTLLTEITVVASPQPSPPPSRVEPVVRVYLPRPGKTFRDCPDCPEIVVIPAGSFRMGDLSGDGYGFEKPIHTVTISRPITVGKYEVTFAEWDACVSVGGCSHRPIDKGWGRDRRPVINVSWTDAQKYVSWLTRKTGKRYRLLSEAEWEYIARAGSSTKYPWQNSISSSQARVNSRDGTVPVGSYGPNAFGVYDTVGNVWEWTEDCWHRNYNEAPTDGSAWISVGECGRRVLRGGSWIGIPRVARSANRYWNSASYRGSGNGFRVARDLY